MHGSLAGGRHGGYRFGKKVRFLRKRALCGREGAPLDNVRRTATARGAGAALLCLHVQRPQNLALAVPRNVPYILACFLVIALFRLTATELRDQANGIDRGFGPFLYHLGTALAWTVLTYVLLLLIDRIPVERLWWRPLVTIVLPVAALLTLGRLVTEALMVTALAPAPRPFGPLLSRLLLGAWHRALLDTIAVWGIGYTVHSYRQRRSAEQHAMELERELARAQLEALRAQIRPHFLFNALHSVAALIAVDADAAKRMIVRVSELLRLSLATANRPFLPLQHELEIIDRYLAVQQIRFTDRLRVVTEIAGDCLDAAVPPFLLQPIVENSIVHGVEETDDRPCTITIRAERQENELRIEVSDDGPGSGPAPAEGIGLSNTRERLAVLYGPRASLSVLRDHGFATIVRLPFSLECGSAPATALTQPKQSFGLLGDGGSTPPL